MNCMFPAGKLFLYARIGPYGVPKALRRDENGSIGEEYAVSLINILGEYYSIANVI